MGIKNQGSQNLVVMTNKDVHFISNLAVQHLADAIAESDKLFETTDVKSGATVYVQVPNVSTIVVEGNRNA